MAHKITKEVASALHLRKELVWRVYDHINTDAVSGWVITHVVGTWTNAGTVADGNYFVATSSDGQQIIMSANDSGGTVNLTWGTAGKIASTAVGLVYSPTGGWVTGDLNFTNATLPPTYVETTFIAFQTTSIYHRVSIITEADAIIVFWFAKHTSPPAVTDSPRMIYAGLGETAEVADVQPYVAIAGEPVATASTGCWGYRIAGLGRVVNTAGNAFEAGFMGPVLPIGGYGQTKGGRWVEFDCAFMYSSAAPKYSLKLKHVKRIDSSSGTLNTDQAPVSRVCVCEVTVPWE